MRIASCALAAALIAVAVTAPESGSSAASRIVPHSTEVTHSTVADVPFPAPSQAEAPHIVAYTQAAGATPADTTGRSEATPVLSRVDRSSTLDPAAADEPEVDSSKAVSRPDATTTAGDVATDLALGVAGGVVGAVGGSILAGTIACAVGLVYVLIGCPIFVPPAIVVGAAVGGTVGAIAGARYRSEKERTAAVAAGRHTSGTDEPQVVEPETVVTRTVQTPTRGSDVARSVRQAPARTKAPAQDPLAAVGAAVGSAVNDAVSSFVPGLR